MAENNQILEGLNTALRGLGEMQNALLQKLTPEQRAKVVKFQENVTKLQMVGDLNGVEKLKEQFKEEMK